MVTDSSSKRTSDVEKGECLEGFRENADVLEVNDADTPSRDVVEEIMVGDVGMIDGEFVRQRDGRGRGLSPSRAARKCLVDVLFESFGADERYRCLVILEELMPDRCTPE